MKKNNEMRSKIRIGDEVLFIQYGDCRIGTVIGFNKQGGCAIEYTTYTEDRKWWRRLLRHRSPIKRYAIIRTEDAVVVQGRIRGGAE